MLQSRIHEKIQLWTNITNRMFATFQNTLLIHSCKFYSKISATEGIEKLRNCTVFVKWIETWNTFLDKYALHYRFSNN